MKIDLICPPFHNLEHPSLGLTQLSSIIEKDFKDNNVNIRTFYFNQFFTNFLPIEFYNEISFGFAGLITGMADFFFNKEAFPNLVDNTDEYLRWLKRVNNQYYNAFIHTLMPLREKLGNIIDNYIIDNEIHTSDIVGLTSVFRQNLACLAFANRLKKLNSRIIIVLGGANCEFPMGLEILNCSSSVDYVFSGVATISFPAFISKMLKKEDSPIEINGILSKKNISNRDIENKLEITTGEELDINKKISLNYIPFLNSYFKNIYPLTNRKPTLFLETSKGCYYGEKVPCTFCGLNGTVNTFRKMESEIAIKYIEEHVNKYYNYCDFFHFVDNSMPKNYPIEVYSKLQIPENISFLNEVRPNLSEDEIQTISERNFVLQPGIESLYSPVLKLMRKGTSLSSIIVFLKTCRKYNIKLHWNLLVGFPNEPEDQYFFYLENLSSFHHLYPPSLNRVRFVRYSSYFNNRDFYNLNLEPTVDYFFSYPIDKDFVNNIAYHFNDINTNTSYHGYIAKYMPQLQQKVNIWKSLWTNDENSIPQLVLKDNYIIDSRFEKVDNIKIDNSLKEILEYFSLPREYGSWINKFDSNCQQELKNKFEFLLSRKLLIADSAKYCSLVINE